MDHVATEIAQSEVSYLSSLAVMRDVLLPNLESFPASPPKILALLRSVPGLLTLHAAHPLLAPVLPPVAPAEAAADPDAASRLVTARAARVGKAARDTTALAVAAAAEYRRYGAAFGPAIREMDLKMKKSKDFRFLIQMLQEKVECKGLSLQSFLIMPVQRMPRYGILLQELLKQAGKEQKNVGVGVCAALDEAVAALEAGVESVTEEIVSVNEAIRAHEAAVVVRGIEGRFVGDVDLALEGRSFIREGSLIKVCRRENKRFHFLLFSDLLVYTEKIAGGRLVMHRQLPLRGLKALESEEANKHRRRKAVLRGSGLEADPEAVSGAGGSSSAAPPEASAGSDFGFRLVSQEKSFEVLAESAEERKQWLEAIRAAQAKLARAGAGAGAGAAAGAAGAGAGAGDGAGAGEVAESTFEAPVWEQDHTTQHCVMCTSKFTTTKRRHHCRKCGSVCCAACSSHKLALHERGTASRVCDGCYFAVEDEQRTDKLQREAGVQKVAELQEKFSGKVQLVSPGRFFVRAGPLSKVCRRANKRFYFFLFNDLIVYGEKDKGEKYDFHRSIPLLTARVLDVVAAGQAGAETAPPEHAFQIFSPQKSFTVFADSESEKLTWMVAIFQAIEELKTADQTAASAGAAAQEPKSVAAIWKPDSTAKTCSLCSKKFSLTTRRHHCRACGALCCAGCSNHNITLPHFSSPVRACIKCAKATREGEKKYSTLQDLDQAQANSILRVRGMTGSGGSAPGASLGASSSAPAPAPAVVAPGSEPAASSAAAAASGAKPVQAAEEPAAAVAAPGAVPAERGGHSSEEEGEDLDQLGGDMADDSSYDDDDELSFEVEITEVNEAAAEEPVKPPPKPLPAPPTKKAAPVVIPPPKDL